VVSIDIRDAAVDFPVFDAKTRSLKKAVLGRAGGRIGTDTKVPIIQALRDITLSVKAAMSSTRASICLRVMPRNSPRMRMLSSPEISGSMPTRGRAQVIGKVAPVFDLAVGMDPEISGLDNILIRGLFLGMTRKQMEARVDDIAAFTELGDYLDMPLRTYSTGMRVRLALGVVTSVDPEILLLDEGIGAVDAEFLAKARDRLKELVERSGMLVFASHSDEFLADLCSTAIWMEHGTIKEHGPLRDVLHHYKGHDVIGELQNR
jgi:ABC-2 type transport system ATP-binding protein